jgi:putative oxidoreductase
MERILGRFTPQIYAMMRIVVGLLFFCHGAQKIFGVMGGKQVEYASMMGLAGFIELIAGVLVAIGLVTGYAATIASGEMAAAYFMAHAPQGGMPIQNGGELAVLYCFVFFYIAARGAGVWSVDGAMRSGPNKDPLRPRRER